MYNTSSSINIHPSGDKCLDLTIKTHDAPMPFKVFKIKFDGNEINIFLTSDIQYDQLIDEMKSLIADCTPGAVQL